MSKICIKCGNVIPDGMDICPNCGREEYDDSNLNNVLSELGLSMDKEAKPDTKAVDTDSTENEPTIRMPVVDEEADFVSENKDAGDSPEDSIEAILEDAVKEQAKRPTAPKKQQPRKRPESSDVRKMPETRKKRPVAKQQIEEEPQKNSAAVIGVVIGLIIALLVIGCGVMFMLFRMGFFTSMSDDDLLNTPAVDAVVTEPAAEPEQTPEQPQTPAIGSEVESASSELETSVPDDSVEAQPAEEETVECTKFTITGTEYIILYSRGVTEEISFVIEPSELRNKIKWESSDETIATVDSQGTIRARRGGTCTITGTCGDKSIKAYVTNEFTVPETTLDMNMEDITMTYEGQTAELAIDYELTDEQIKATVWESSDEKVAMVDKNGVVTAVANGTAVITASIGDYTASCIVRCVDVTGNRGYNNSESEYVINADDITLSRKGEYFQLALKSVVGKDVPEYTWESDDPNVVTVDSKGVVTAVSNGTAYVTTSIGQDKFRCIVRVSIAG